MRILQSQYPGAGGQATIWSYIEIGATRAAVVYFSHVVPEFEQESRMLQVDGLRYCKHAFESFCERSIKRNRVTLFTHDHGGFDMYKSSREEFLKEIH
jgi:hypothetical protein